MRLATTSGIFCLCFLLTRPGRTFLPPLSSRSGAAGSSYRLPLVTRVEQAGTIQVPALRQRQTVGRARRVPLHLGLGGGGGANVRYQDSQKDFLPRGREHRKISTLPCQPQVYDLDFYYKAGSLLLGTLPCYIHYCTSPFYTFKNLISQFRCCTTETLRR